MIKSKSAIVTQHVAAIIAAVCFLAGSASAIEMVKNVNSGHPPKDILVVFDKKAKDAKSFKAEDKHGNAELAFADDGALLVKLNKRGGSEIVFPFPEEVDLTKANYILFTCKLEGQWFTWGKWAPYTGAKLWSAGYTYDAEGLRSAGYVNYDSVAPDGYLPTETKTLSIPVMLLTGRAEGFANPERTKALSITFGNVREENNRDYTFTIDRISVAE